MRAGAGGMLETELRGALFHWKTFPGILKFPQKGREKNPPKNVKKENQKQISHVMFFPFSCTLLQENWLDQPPQVHDQQQAQHHHLNDIITIICNSSNNKYSQYHLQSETRTTRSYSSRQHQPAAKAMVVADASIK